MVMPMLKAIIFDFGGVISASCWDPYEVAELITKVLKKYDVKYPDNFPEIFREVSDKVFEEMDRTGIEIPLKETVRQALEKANIDFDELILEEALELIRDAPFCIPRPEVKEVLKKIKSLGLKIGLISNTPDVHPFRMLLREELYNFFDAIILSCWTKIRKPNPEIFRIALRKLKVNANEAIFVGDIPGMDIAGAKAAGIKTVLMRIGEPYWVMKGVTRKDQNIMPDYEIDTLMDLIPIIEREIKEK